MIPEPISAASLTQSTPVELLLLRLAITPTLVGLVALVQRRFGDRLGGRLVGFPLTTAPFLLVLCLTHGAALTAAAAHGVVVGQISVVLFCLTYARLAPYVRPWVALAISLVGGTSCVLGLATVASTWAAAAIVLTFIGIALLTWPVVPTGAVAVARTESRWETPLRMTMAGTVVAALTGAARILGPELAGVLSTAPVLLSVLTPTTHRAAGSPAARLLLRGAVTSMPASVMFSAVLESALTRVGTFPAFLLAGIAMVLADALAQLLVRRPAARSARMAFAHAAAQLG
jgi:hypothetical protein